MRVIIDQNAKSPCGAYSELEATEIEMPVLFYDFDTGYRIIRSRSCPALERYAKWKKNPDRLIKAAEAASPQPKRHRRLRPVQSSTPVESEREAVQQPPQLPLRPPGHSGESESRAALSLLQKAHQQLSTRKQTIESELARIEGLRSEYEAVTAQVAALDEAIKTFQGAALK